jgi:pilus assembly protein CpaF
MDLAESSTNNEEKIKRLKESLVKQILQEFDPSTIPVEDQNQYLVDSILEKFHHSKLSLPEEIRNPVFHSVINEVLGFGILQPFLDDPTVTQVIVNGQANIILEINGQFTQINQHFADKEEFVQLIKRNLKRFKFQVDTENPVLDAYLPDGSLLIVIFPPIAIGAPILSIQKPSKCKLKISDLLDLQMLNDKTSEFLQACVRTHLNILITGLGKSGKTALLNSLAAFIPEIENIVTIEENPQLDFPHNNVSRLESRSSTQEGKHFFTSTDLVQLALRVHPNRLIIDEVRGAECMAVLEVLEIGCNGSIVTMHASSATEAVSRMETMCLMTGINYPMRVVHEKIASSLDLIIQVSHLKDGTRRITTITEISGTEPENVILTDIFRFVQAGTDSNGKVLGNLKPTGIRPIFTPRLEANGFVVSPDFFGTDLAEFFIE